MNKQEAINDFYKKLAKQVNFKKANNVIDSYEIALNDPFILNKCNKLSQEEYIDLQQEFEVTLNKAKEDIKNNSITPEIAQKYYFKLRNLFIILVSGRTPLEEWLETTDDMGSQSLVILPAGEHLIDLFFEGDIEGWSIFCGKLDAIAYTGEVIQVYPDMLDAFNDLSKLYTKELPYDPNLPVEFTFNYDNKLYKEIIETENGCIIHDVNSDKMYQTNQDILTILELLDVGR